MIELQRSVLDLCIVCSNFDDSLNFYHKLLGFEISAETEIPADVAMKFGLAPMEFRQVRLKAGDSLLKLMEISEFCILRKSLIKNLINSYVNKGLPTRSQEEYDFVKFGIEFKISKLVSK